MSINPVVLYVEDDPRSRKVMKLCMEHRLRFTHVTILEDSTNFAWQIAHLDPAPEIIFLDIHVQPLNGFEMLALIRQTPTLARVPVLALTASVMGEEVKRLRDHGFTGCLAKPLDLDRFPTILQQILRGESVWSITS